MQNVIFGVAFSPKFCIHIALITCKVNMQNCFILKLNLTTAKAT